MTSTLMLSLIHIEMCIRDSLSSCQNQRFQIKFTQVEAIHVGTDDTHMEEIAKSIR